MFLRVESPPGSSLSRASAAQRPAALATAHQRGPKHIEPKAPRTRPAPRAAMSSKKAAKAAKAAKRSSKLVDAAEVGDVETMARVMSSGGGKLDLDVLVAVEG